MGGVNADNVNVSRPQWCESKKQCRRLQLKDLLVVPLQRFTRYPLLLKNMEKRSCSEAEKNALQNVVELVDTAICKSWINPSSSGCTDEPAGSLGSDGLVVKVLAKGAEGRSFEPH